MNIHDLTLNQLKQAVSIKQHIERLNRELRNILLAPRNSRGASTKKSMTSASTKKKIAAAQKRQGGRRCAAVNPLRVQLNPVVKLQRRE